METTYWLVALPLEGRLSRGAAGAEQVLKVLNDKTAPDLSTNYKFNMPELRVGTLDALLALSDDMVKTVTHVEAVVGKIRRQLAELDRNAAELSELAVDGVPLRRYLTAFQWNEAKHPARRPLRETVEKLGADVGALEDELKVKASEYGSAKGALGALTRKAGGSLATRDLGDVLGRVGGASALTESEHLTTLLVAIPAHALRDWRASYETMAAHVVPRSSKLLAEEADYALVTVVLFRRAADAFRTAARKKGYQVREHAFDAAGSAASAAETTRLTADVAARKANLAEWCRTAFGDAFSAMLHANAVRLFVESILRYGLPPAFASVLMAPADVKNAKRLRSIMASAFGRTASAHWKQREDDAAKGEEVFPYVSLTIELPTA